MNITRETMQSDRRAALLLSSNENAAHDFWQERNALVRTLPREERQALIDTARADGDAARVRVAAALVLPPLTGSFKQIEWAIQLRKARLDQVLEFVGGVRDGTVAYRLAVDWDPLEINYLKPWFCYEYPGETEYITALNRVLDHEQRRPATWWIDTRR